MEDAVTVAILAGGKSSRMGTDKSFVPLLGKTLIQHVLERVGSLGLPTILITNRPAAYAPLGLPMYGDLLAGKGSLGGLYTAISCSQTLYTLCVACDMPFLNPALLAHLISLRAGYDAIVPRLDGFPEALHAVYSKGCLGAIREKLEQDQLKAISFYGQVRLRFVEEDEVRRFDPALRSFVNVNTPEELARLQAATADDSPAT
ncbi:MAG: molybdenum cofactor guanylyltransferase [Anaerolineae bacterium]|nr:molybdenum cofactor guanylyltransferase [Anaerolineae bacterium]